MATFVHVKCDCGKAIQVPIPLKEKAVKCPACKKTNRVGEGLKNTRPRKAFWLLLAGGLSLAAFGAVWILLVPNRPAANENGSQTAVPAPKRIERKDAVPPGPDREVVFDRFDPAEPKEGEEVTVYLKEKPARRVGVPTFQYRLESSEAWRSAPDGRFVISNLKPGSSTVEARVLDPNGNASSIAKAVLLVTKIPLAPPSLEIAKIEPAEPREGDVVTLTLRAEQKGFDSKKLSVEYRLGSDVDWRTAGGLELKIGPMREGKHLLEARAKGGEGLVSAIAARTWIVGGSRMELALQMGHQKTVVAMAMSRDGNYAFTGSYDRSVHMWEVATGKKVMSFRGHDYYVSGLALCRDGSKLWTSGADHKLILWDIPSGQRLRTLEARSERKNSYPSHIAINADGKYFAAIEAITPALRGEGANGTDAVLLWDIASGKRLQTFSGHKKKITSLALSSDDQHVITGSLDGTVIVWNTATGQKVRTLSHDAEGSDFEVALSKDGRRLATSRNGSVILWDLATGAKLHHFQNGLGGIALNRDGSKLLAAISRTEAVLFETSSGNKLRTLTLPFPAASPPQGLLFDEECRYIIVSLHDGTAMLWDINTGEKLQTFRGDRAYAGVVAVSRDEKTLAAGSLDGSVILCDLTTGKVLQTLGGPDFSPHGLALSGNGKHLAAISSSVPLSSGNKQAALWDLAGKRRMTFEGHTQGITALALSGDGKMLLSGSYDGSALLWDTGSGKKLQTFRRSEFGMYAVALSEDGRTAVTGGQKENAKAFSPAHGATVWDTESGKKLQTILPDAVPWGIALTADGKKCLMGLSGIDAVLWDVVRDKQLQVFKGHSNGIRSVALSRDGKFAVTASHDKSVLLWDVADGRKLQSFRSDDGAITQRAALSGGGKQVWTASEDGPTRLWDAASGKEQARVYAFDQGKEWLIVTSDGYFDGSRGARQFLAYRYVDSLRLASDEATLERFYRPGLLSQLLGTAKN